MQLKLLTEPHIVSIKTKIDELRKEAENGCFPFYQPDKLAGRKAQALEGLLKSLDSAESVNDFKQKLTTFAFNHIDIKNTGSNQVDINEGRGTFTKWTGIDTTSTKLVKSFKEAVDEATEQPTARPSR